MPNPEKVPFIMKNDVANFYLKFKKPFSETQRITFSYRDSITNEPYQSDIEINPHDENIEFV